jgi:outer membrane protein OmpA-like peptidoglycan-associated protein
MIKRNLLVMLCLSLFSLAVQAGPGHTAAAKSTHKDEIGLGIGAVIGGLIAGPPGAIIGAAGGAWYGQRMNKKADKVAALKADLTKKQTETAYLQFGQELHKVKLQNRKTALEELSHGVSLTVYFRTDSAEIDQQALPRISQLAAFLKEFPEIQLHLDAHADRRGSEDYNRKLSLGRARAVQQALVNAGIDGRRIHAHAYGETGAGSTEGDTEGMMFDRRVNIILNLDTQA